MAQTESVPARRAAWRPVSLAGGVAAAALAASVALRHPLLAGSGSTAAADALAGSCLVLAAAVVVAVRRKARADGPATVLGRAVAFPWTTVRLGRGDRLRHVLCVGQGASGRTHSVLAPMLVQDLASGAGMTVIELRGGELCGVARMWAERLGRPVIEWEPGNPESGCWNPLAHPSPAAAERLAQALQRRAGSPSSADFYGGDGGSLLRHAVAAFASARAPLDLCRLRTFLADDVARQETLRTVSDPPTLRYFDAVFGTWSLQDRARRTQRAVQDLDALLAQPFVRRALCPPPGAPTIALPNCLHDAGVLLVQLPLGDALSLAEVLGSLLLSSLQAAVYERGPDEALHFLYLDEFERFTGPGFGEFLALSRGYRVGSVLALASLCQPRAAGGTSVEDAVRANAQTTVVLRCDGADAAALAPGLPRHRGRAWSADDLTQLPFGTGVACAAGGRPRARRIRLRYVSKS
jgi:hypothetical protein